jgi:hypothetical protein
LASMAARRLTLRDGGLAQAVEVGA